MSSSQINNLRTQLACALSDEIILLSQIQSAEDKITSLKAQLLAAEKEKEVLNTNLAQAAASVTSIRKTIDAVSKKDVNIWGVSDNHSYCSSGYWALEATETSTYAIGVTKSSSDAANMETTLYNGETVTVSKKRFQGCENIKVGDILYMGDKKRKTLFKGVVTGYPVKGLFRSTDPAINSFRRRVDHRYQSMNKKLPDFSPIEEEIEILWEVQWECVGKLTKEIKEKIYFSDRSRTVRELKSHPI